MYRTHGTLVSPSREKRVRQIGLPSRNSYGLKVPANCHDGDPKTAGQRLDCIEKAASHVSLRRLIVQRHEHVQRRGHRGPRWHLLRRMGHWGAGRAREPAGEVPETASTLVHQILSVIVERGGIRARPMYDLLCGPSPFASISNRLADQATRGNEGSSTLAFSKESTGLTIQCGNRPTLEAVVGLKSHCEKRKYAPKGGFLGRLAYPPGHREASSLSGA